MSDQADIFKIPHDTMNELIVLAAAMQSDKARAELASRVRPEHFQDAEQAAAWSLVLRCHVQGHKPTPETIAKMSGGKLDLQFLRELVENHPKAPHDLRYHIEALQWDLTRARAVNGPISELLRGLQDPATAPERIRALSRQVPVSLQGGGSRVHLRDGSQLVAEHKATLQNRKQGIALFPTGIAGLDVYPDNALDDDGNDVTGEPLLVPGLEPGKITTVTAISGGGKSTLTALMALNQARFCAERGQGKVLYGSWEMAPQDTLELMACISIGLQRQRVKTGRTTDAEDRLLLDRMNEIRKWVRFVDMPFGKERGVRRTHDEVLDEIHGYIADSGASLAVFDLWRRAFRRMRDESDESEALYRQQAIAEETNCHCVLVQQQRLKDIETRANPAPTREGIKGSSAWVDVSDTILGVYLPGLMKRVSRNVIQLHVLKQRFGRWPLVIEYAWDGDLVKLSNPQMVWDMAVGDEQRARSGGASGKPVKKQDKDLDKMLKAKTKK